MKPKRYLAGVVCTFLTFMSLSAETLYVDVNSSAGAPDGSSWAQAYPDLQDALAVAGDHTQVWVAAGTYTPGAGDRTAVFTVPAGAELYGGFAGNESTLLERDTTAHPTILSGDLNADDPAVTSDNSYTVVNLLNDSILDGFTISGGFADASSGTIERHGGGIYTDALRVTIRHCRLVGNHARQGAGLYADNNNKFLFLTDCVFDQNESDTASTTYGGALAIRRAHLVYLLNCRFTRNFATGQGGAVYLDDAPSVIHGCIFAGNECTSNGGAIAADGAALTLSNSTLVGNVGNYGAAVYLSSGGRDLFLRNNIIADNTGPSGPTAQIRGYYLFVSHCLIPEGLATDAQIFTEDIVAEPTGMIDPDGADDIYGTADDNYALAPGSACRDAGTNRGALPDIAALMDRGGASDLLLAPLPDLLGHARIRGPYVDIGALEYQDTTYTPTVHYVRPDATGTGDGSSWEDAYPDLQAALDAKPGAGDEIWVAAGRYTPSVRPLGQDNDKGLTFVLPAGVALYGGFAGTETMREERDPAAHSTILSGDLLGDDEAEGGGFSDNVASVLQGSNLALLDGFIIERAYYTYATRKWPAPQEGAGLRNVMASPWLRNCHFRNLQGIEAAGVYNRYSLAGFSQCVFTGNSAESVSIVESELSACRWIDCAFRENLKAPFANERDLSLFDGCVFENNSGGVLRLTQSFDVLMRHCRLTGNSGIGVDIYGGFNLLENNLFETNRSGAALELEATSSVVRDCDFRANTYRAVSCGSGSSGSRFYNCRFWENFFDRGAAATVVCNQASPVFINCLFWGNIADAMPGAHYDGEGGCVHTFSASPSFYHCTFAHNYADNGSVFYNAYNGHPKVYNSIFWGNTGGAQIVNTGSSPSSTTIRHSIVQGGYSGEGNLNADPLFYDPNGPDGIWGNEDDDFRLRTGSAALDVGDLAQLPADVHDLDGDLDTAEALPLDLLGAPRLQDAGVDMGALEGDAGLPDFPNLRVVALEMEPAVAGYLEELTFTITVENNGAFAAGSFLVGFWPHSVNQPTDPTAAPQTVEVPGLVAGASTTVEFLFTPNSMSTRTAWAFVDAEALTGRVDETDESDNWIDVGFVYEVIFKYADLVITSVGLNPDPPAPGDDFNFEITVQNIGEGPAARFHVAHFLDFGYTPYAHTYSRDTVECDGLAAGASVVLPLPHSAANETGHTSYFIADSQYGSSRISESDEDNNRFPAEGPYAWKAEDGLPDAWEIAVFGSTAHSPEEDPQGDGVTVYDHFVLGTSPTGESPPFTVHLVHDGSGLLLEFPTVPTDATYAGLERHYRIETRNDLTGEWSVMSGAEDLIADGTTLDLDLSGITPPFFCRCLVWLE
jgi:hypothetical protein